MFLQAGELIWLKKSAINTPSDETLAQETANTRCTTSMLIAHAALNLVVRRLLPSITGKALPMKRHALTKAIALATLLSAASFNAVAEDVALSEVVVSDVVATKVVSVDPANHNVVLKGPDGKEFPVTLTDKAKNLDKLKAGDEVDIRVTSAIAAHLDTDIDKGLPGSVERAGEVRAAPGSDTPGGEAYRQVQVQLKITHIDVAKNQVTFEGPKGNTKIVDVKKPEVQAKLKDLKVGQSVIVTYTDILTVTSKH